MTERNRARTEQRLIKAVGALLSKQGFRSLGVNAIARQARVDKALIYRYFDGLDGLLAAFVGSDRHFPALSSIAEAAYTDSRGVADFAGRVILAFARRLRQDEVSREILRWELFERNELSDALAASREEDSMRLFEAFEARFGDPGVDAPAIASLLSAGLTFLILRSKTYPDYNGIPLRSDEGWERLENAVRTILDAVMPSEE